MAQILNILREIQLEFLIPMVIAIWFLHRFDKRSAGLSDSFDRLSDSFDKLNKTVCKHEERLDKHDVDLSVLKTKVCLWSSNKSGE